jgi:hypothetical protein
VEFTKDVIDYWDPLVTAVSDAISETDRTVVFLVDELPFFLENLIREGEGVVTVGQILSTLRVWRRNPRIAMVLAGSISIDSMIRDLGISGLVLNDVSRLSLGALERSQAQKLLDELVSQKQLKSWTDETKNEVLNRLGDLFPFFVQCAFHHLSVEDRADDEYLERTFRLQIEPDIQRAFFAQFDERLRQRFVGAERELAERILDSIATRETVYASEFRRAPANPDIDVDRVITKLIEQEFIVRGVEAGTLCYPLEIIRRWRLSRSPN